MPVKDNAAKTENFRLAKSQVVYYTAGTYDLIRIPQYGFVVDVFLNVVTAYAGTNPTITVGWKGNGETAQTAGFMSNNIADPGNTGMKRAQKDTLVSSPGKWFSAGSGTITLTIGGTPTAGKCKIFAVYSVIH